MTNKFKAPLVTLRGVYDLSKDTVDAQPVAFDLEFTDLSDMFSLEELDKEVLKQFEECILTIKRRLDHGRRQHSGA